MNKYLALLDDYIKKAEDRLSLEKEDNGAPVHLVISMPSSHGPVEVRLDQDKAIVTEPQQNEEHVLKPGQTHSEPAEGASYTMLPSDTGQAPKQTVEPPHEHESFVTSHGEVVEKDGMGAGIGSPAVSADTFTPTFGGGGIPKKREEIEKEGVCVCGGKCASCEERMHQEEKIIALLPTPVQTPEVAQGSPAMDAVYIPTEGGGFQTNRPDEHLLEQQEDIPVADKLKNMMAREAPSNSLKLLKSADGKFIIWGLASTDTVDKEGHVVSIAALQEALPKFLNSGYPLVQVFHSDLCVGKIIPEYIADDGTLYKTEVDPEKGLFVVAELRDDLEVARNVRKEILAGNLNSFSIAGNATQYHNECDAHRGCYTVIDRLELAEISVCLVPMNSNAKFILVQDGQGNCPVCDPSKRAGYSFAAPVKI